jgi:CRP-like cAMP-binding protein
MLLEIEPLSVPTRAPRELPVTAPLPCETCYFRKSNFCGALFGGSHDGDAIKVKHCSTAARQNIYRAGEPSEGVLLICEGWAVRYVQLPNGRRQILSVVQPGELVSARSMMERQFAFSVQAVTNVRYCYIPFAEVRKKLQANPALLDIWLKLTAAEHRHADKQLVDLGQRTAQERIVALLVAMLARAEQRGELQDDEFPFPMSQQQIADFTGLTPVHACRVLSSLRKNGICDVGHGVVKIGDRAELGRIEAQR